MLQHHIDAQKRTVDLFKDDPTVLALIFGGSVQHELARPDSDIDIMIIVTQEEYARRKEAMQLYYYNASDDICPWPEGYVDGKFFDIPFLRLAAEKASDPTRWAFKDTRIEFCKDPEIIDLVEKIQEYPEELHLSRLRSYYAQARWWSSFFMDEGVKRDSIYLKSHAAVHLALFTARLFLTYNRMLFPFHKWMLTELERAPKKPEDLLEAIDAVLKNPNQETARALFAMTRDYRTWEITDKETHTLFVGETEIEWMQGIISLENY